MKYKTSYSIYPDKLQSIIFHNYQTLYIILIDLYRRFLYPCAAFYDASHTHFFKDYTQTKFYHSHVKMLIDPKYDVRTKDEY